MKRTQPSYALDACLILVLCGALIWPLFTLHHMNNWASIESTFIADGRFLKDRLPHPGWQPLWYCGGRFDYIYPPALRYGTALIASVFGVDTFRSYHLYVALFYCLAMVGVYWLLRVLTGSRGLAWLGAVASAFISPTYLFFHDIRLDAAAEYSLPMRLNVLVRYGEGPHMTAFAWLPFALAAAWVALPGRRPAALGLAALFSALVVSNNFYGATALVLLFAPLVWAAWLTSRNHWVWLRAAAIAGLAYGLTAFWLTPSYLEVTLRNMNLVSRPGNLWSFPVAAATALVFCAVTYKAAKGRPDRAWPVFVWGALVSMGLTVFGEHYIGFRLMGEPARLVPELDLVLILVACELLRRAWNWPQAGWRRWALRLALAMAVVACFVPSKRYASHAWKVFHEDADWERRIEYRLTSWLKESLPDSRVLATGSLRFWFNAWHDLAQVGGGSEQGVQNQRVVPGYLEVVVGENPEIAVLWLQALGADAVLVHTDPSMEVYKDFVHPKKFEGILPVLHDSGEGDRVYGVPRRFPGLARVVDPNKLRSLERLDVGVSWEAVRAYVEAVEQGPDSEATWQREGTTKVLIRATLREGEAVLAQENWDPAWKAYAGGKSIPIEEDPLGFMLIRAPAGEQEITLVFATPLENQFGRGLTALSCLIFLGLLVAGARGRKNAP